MVIQLSPELEQAVREHARQQGVTPEALALSALHERFTAIPPSIQPNDEWERELLAIGSDCGVSLSNESLSREELYD